MIFSVTQASLSPSNSSLKLFHFELTKGHTTLILHTMLKHSYFKTINLINVQKCIEFTIVNKNTLSRKNGHWYSTPHSSMKIRTRCTFIRDCRVRDGTLEVWTEHTILCSMKENGHLSRFFSLSQDLEVQKLSFLTLLTKWPKKPAILNNGFYHL